MQTITGKIWPSDLAAFKRGVARFEKRTVALGHGAIAYEIGPLTTYKGTLPSGREVDYQSHPVTVEYQLARIDGWEFVARIEHVGDELCVVKPIPGYKPAAKWYAAKDWCDHCNTANKGRKDSYLLRREGSTRVIKQVGRTCVRKFIGLDPKEAFAVVDFGEWLDAVGCDGEMPEEGGFGGRRTGYTLAAYLPHVAACIRNDGWASKAMVAEQKAEASTSERAVGNLEPSPRTVVHAVTAADVELGEKAALWAARQDPKGSDYLRNIKVIAKAGFTEYRQMGYAASIIPAYQRALEWTAKAQRERANELPSSHVGTVGERVVVKVTLKAVKHFDGDYGLRVMHRFVAESGDVLVWWSSGKQLGERGDELTIRGTVKGHESYKDVKQTKINRVSEVAA